jgi:hypothetical protein
MAQRLPMRSSKKLALQALQVDGFSSESEDQHSLKESESDNSSEDDTNDSSSANSNDDDEPVHNNNEIIGKDKTTKWSTQFAARKAGRERDINIVQYCKPSNLTHTHYCKWLQKKRHISLGNL